MFEWISVKDRLPEKEGRYLCCYKLAFGIVFVAVLYFTYEMENVDEFVFAGKFYPGWFEYHGEYGLIDREVTHWMPLPELPCTEQT